ncbi:MAG: 1,4-dihydroxy-2-naphthoate polyprenyltransferase [Chloroflexi bacterium]|nr:1,4-dihydroxy-2-naphthoate polyprenyltransferase [Chloroflexota bacterium]
MVWIAGARPATLPAAIVPVLVGTAIGAPATHVRLAPFLAALGAAILIQVGTNYFNDYADFRAGADTAARLGPRRLASSGLATPRAVLIAALLAFGGAGLIGLYLVVVGGWPILVIGMLSIVCGFAYTGGPWPLAYVGLGDLFVFLFFGVVAVVGSAYLQSGDFMSGAILVSLPVGCLVTAILVVNNLRDIETDGAAGKRTLAVRLGAGAARAEYVALIAAAYASVLGMWFASPTGGSLFWLPFLTLPLALALLRTVLTSDAPASNLNAALKGTGMLHLSFGVLLALAFILVRVPTG